MPAMPEPMMATSAFSSLSSAGASFSTVVPIQRETLFSLLTFMEGPAE